MNIVYGNFEEAVRAKDYHAVIFSSNGIIKQNGALVMGAGAALIIRDAFPGIDKDLGKIIKSKCPTDKGNPYIYNLTGCKRLGKPDISILALQVKRDYNQLADITFLAEGLSKLRDYIIELHTVNNLMLSLSGSQEVWDFKGIMNFPGIGFGGLSVSQVEPLLIQYLEHFNIDIYRK